MPSFKGSAVHQVIGDYECASEEDMCIALNDYNFIIVDQFYNMSERDSDTQDWQSRGKLIINTACIGKAQMHLDAPPKRFTTETKRR